jgi:hypothetical protein
LGEHKLKEKEVFEQVRGLEKIILHPKYKSMFLEGILDTPPDFDLGKNQFSSNKYKNLTNFDVLFFVTGFLF